MAVIMRAGRLRHRIAIQAQATSQDAYGETTGSWATITGGTVYAAIAPVRSAEIVDGDKATGLVTHRIIMRNNGLTVTTKNRITHSGRTFEIVQVINRDERDAMYEIRASEVI